MSIVFQIAIVFFIGLIGSFLWGAYAALVFVPLHNYFFRKWGGASS